MTIWIFLAIVLSLTSHSESYKEKELIPNAPIGSDDALKQLIVRLLGKQGASNFRLQIDTSLKADGRDFVKVVKKTRYDPVVVYASSGTAAAYGFNNYLKTHLKCQVSWDGQQLSLPNKESMPLVEYHMVLDRYRYYMNVCTFSYSYVWWNWDQWERHIDWMVLNGYNLVLALTGSEFAWYTTYLSFGFSPNDINEYFTGPAFLAWNRMGNIQGGTGLSLHWLRQQMNLQIAILGRMRSLGITSVLPAFSGFVPRAITKLFPNASITYTPKWNNFPDKYCCPAMLSPSDPAFITIGQKFVEIVSLLYGTDHVYSSDPFNEMTPPTTNLNQLSEYSRSIYSSMAASDSSAVWLLQGWFMGNNAKYWTADRSKAFLTSVPVGKLIVLDLQADINPQYSRLQNFFGHSYIWCMLHNFGGTLGLQGAVEQVYQKLNEARKSEGSTLIGTGITMEGIGSNYVVYDFMTDLSVVSPRNGTFSIETWFDLYTERRYGESNDDAKLAWNRLLKSVYSYNGNESNHGQYVFTNRPSLKKKVTYWYNPKDVASAWFSLLKASSTLSQMNELYKYDIVDLARQYLQISLDQSYLKIVAAYLNKNESIVHRESDVFLEMLDDLDYILGSEEHFLLGRWLKDAKRSADPKNPLEQEIIEREARQQISLWGPNGEILDYANKQWAGVVRDYFKPRWEVFFKYLKEAMRAKGNFNNKKYQREVFAAEQHFVYSNTDYIEHSEGDSVPKSMKLFQKWEQESGLINE